MSHSYEEIRNAALDVLAEREKNFAYPPEQYSYLRSAIAEVFNRRDQLKPDPSFAHLAADLRGAEADLFMEVFWDLFRQGAITLGLNSSNLEFPFFRVSHFGRSILANQQAYFFHDVESYRKIVVESIPAVDRTTLTYLLEAMQAFKVGCILSATVMLGVATEHTFLLLMECIDANPAHASAFASVAKERMLLSKINKFKSTLDKHYLALLPPAIKEDLDTQFSGIISIIRNFRNQAGHPTGTIVSREQAYVLLQLFVPYCKKMYSLMDHFR